jgi:hypothetical protein
MTTLDWIVALLVAALLSGMAALALLIRLRNMHCWLPRYVFPAEPRARLPEDAAVDIFIAICDHFEPECYAASRETARSRVQRWVNDYPRLFQAFADSDGRPPQHTFFFPQDEYRPEYLDSLKGLCDAGFGDVDVHLHHEADTAESLREKLEFFRDTLWERHGLLRRDPTTGAIVYGFIHGNWALCNSRPDGHCCGVDQELSVLLQTGCYADFTLPSAPSATQTSTINSIYYAADRAGRRKSHDRGIRAAVGQAPPANHLLMIQGPLCLDWGRRKFGMIPRIENADLHAGRPPSLRRLNLWTQSRVHVAGRPDWIFVKLHTHGCKDGNIDMLLSDEMQQFHRQLAAYRELRPEFRYHYVTAWEMAQRVHQAEREEPRPDRTDSARPADSPAPRPAIAGC